ncbi:MAG: response regulator transcription factor [Flavobacteriales bacterium]|jgi:DNA-binding NarL/FixJ family response regulator|nr:response regulator transcription factor [Flavobacteriales bacterium]
MNISVVIADDSDIIRTGLRHILDQSSSIHVCADVDNAQKLMDAIDEYKPNVILLDYTAKGFDLATISNIKIKNNYIKLIGITHHPSKKLVDAALSNGIMSHIKKDCPAQEIIDAVIDSANNKHFFCGEVLELLKQESIDAEVEDEPLNCSPISLSDRELDVVKLISEGYTNAQIAVVLHISNHTVNTHRKNIMRKLGISNTAGIVMFAVKTNLVSPDKFEFSPSENN